MPRRILRGRIVSDKGDKTVIVRVDRQVMHPLYKKYIKRSKRYAAHDEDNRFRTGEWVQIRECRPISRRKCWEVVVGDDEAPLALAATAVAPGDDAASTGASEGEPA